MWASVCKLNDQVLGETVGTPQYDREQENERLFCLFQKMIVACNLKHEETAAASEGGGYWGGSDAHRRFPGILESHASQQTRRCSSSFCH